MSNKGLVYIVTYNLNKAYFGPQNALRPLLKPLSMNKLFIIRILEINSLFDYIKSTTKILKERPTIIHVWAPNYWVILISLLFKYFIKSNIIVTIHNYATDELKYNIIYSSNIKKILLYYYYRIVDALYYLIINRVSALHVLSIYVKNKVIKYYPKKEIYLIPYPLEREKCNATKMSLRIKYGIGLDDIIFINIANFKPNKGHFMLIDSFEKALYINKNYDNKLFLIGSGNSKLVLKILRLIKSKGLDNNIKIYYNVERIIVNELLCLGDCYIMASYEEGFHLPILEALNSYLFLILTPTGFGYDLKYYYSSYSFHKVVDSHNLHVSIANFKISDNDKFKQEIDSFLMNFSEIKICQQILGMYKKVLFLYK